MSSRVKAARSSGHAGTSMSRHRTATRSGNPVSSAGCRNTDSRRPRGTWNTCVSRNLHTSICSGPGTGERNRRPSPTSEAGSESGATTASAQRIGRLPARPIIHAGHCSPRIWCSSAVNDFPRAEHPALSPMAGAEGRHEAGHQVHAHRVQRALPSYSVIAFSSASLVSA